MSKRQEHKVSVATRNPEQRRRKKASGVIVKGLPGILVVTDVLVLWQSWVFTPTHGTQLQGAKHTSHSSVCHPQGAKQEEEGTKVSYPFQGHITMM